MPPVTNPNLVNILEKQAQPAAPAGGGIQITPIMATPKLPTPQTEVEERGQVITNKKGERDLATPEPIPGHPGWFFDANGRPFQMELPTVGATKGQESLDQKFSDDYAQWRLTGQSDATKALKQLTSSAAALQQKNITGPIIGSLPDWLAAYIAPDAIEHREAVEEVAQRNLRAILGGQFAAREGEQLIARAYNPRLPEATNRKRVLRLMSQMVEAAKQKESAARYFEQHGTLKGWEGKLWSVDDFDPEAADNAPEEDQWRQPPGDIGFETPPQDPRGNPLTPEQQAAYNVFLQNNPDATPEDLIGFVRMIGGGALDPARAQDIIDVYRETGKFAPGESAVQPKPDISDARSEDGGLDQSLEAGVRAATRVVPGADKLKAGIEAATTDATYDEALARQRAINDYDWENHPYAATAGTIAGAVAIPTGVRQAARTAAIQVMRSGGTREAAVTAARNAAAQRLAAEGGAYGAAYGAGQGDDLAESAAQAAVSGIAGAATGVVAPFVGQAANATAKAVAPAFGRGQNLADRVVFNTIKADGTTGTGLMRGVNRAEELGVPHMIADTGENARGLLSASARSPGPGRTTAINALDTRQGNLADRVVTHIERDLGPVANPHRVTEDLMTQAQTDAAPLYDAMKTRPGVDAFFTKVKPLLDRPSMQKALANAQKIALEEGRDPTALGFDLNEAGDVLLRRVPSWETLDYVKRGMDDVVEAYRDPTSGKLNLNTEGRAVNNTLRSFLKAFDDANPDYAAARAAYSGPVKGITALNLGRKALNMTADDLEERMRDMTPFERDMFALGTRRAMAELVDSKGDTANVVHALVGTGKKRAMLARLFGNRKEFERFTDTLELEQEAYQTYKRARTGSPTAPNAADDATLAVSTGLTDLVTTGLPIMSFLRVAARSKNKKLVDKAQNRIAEMLGETDPARVREIIRRFKHEEGRLRASRRGKVVYDPRGNADASAIGQRIGPLSVDPSAKATAAPLTATLPSVDLDE